MIGIRRNPLRDRDINPYVEIVIDGEAWRAVQYLIDGWELRSSAWGDKAKTRILTKDEYAHLDKAGRVLLLQDRETYANFASLSPSQRETRTMREFWMGILDDEARGEVEGLTRARVKELISEHKDHVLELMRQYRDSSDFDHGKKRRKKHFGSVGPNAKKSGGDLDSGRVTPTDKTLHDVYRKWIASGRDPWSLVPNTGSHAGGGAKIHPETWKVIQANAEKYATEKKATYNSVLEAINALISEKNIGLGDDAKIPDATDYGIRKGVAELDASVVLGGRLGKKKMVQALRHVGKGPKYTRLGEMTLHDCWSTQLMNLIPAHSQHLFSEGELSTRIVLAVVVDGASGCIIGLRAGKVENAKLTASAYRMAMTDKSAIAAAAGCNSTWDMVTGIEHVKSDSGGAYRNALFMSAAYSLSDRLTFTSAGRANLRGQIEQKFGTMDKQFISNFTGRTGSNVVDRHKDELDPELRASMLIDEFMKLAVRFIVDKHHYTRPKAKIEPSPARKWEELRKLQAKAAPSPQALRVAFGTTTIRKLTRAGLRFMNIIYWNSWLDMILHKNGPTDLYIKVDEENLGAISVLLGNDWTNIPGPRQLEGVSLAAWIEKNAELARRYGEQARLDFEEFVAPAILDIDRAAKHAEAHFNLLDVYWDAARMDQAERDLRVLVVYDRDAEGEEVGLTQDSRQLGSVYSREDIASILPSSTTLPALPTVPTSPSEAAAKRKEKREAKKKEAQASRIEAAEQTPAANSPQPLTTSAVPEVSNLQIPALGKPPVARNRRRKEK